MASSFFRSSKPPYMCDTLPLSMIVCWSFSRARSFSASRMRGWRQFQRSARGNEARKAKEGRAPGRRTNQKNPRPLGRGTRWTNRSRSTAFLSDVV